jgi:hypothetical protein
MRKFSIITLILALSIAFTGCTNNEVKLYNALMKSQDIVSMESDTSVKFALEGEGFSKEDQQKFEEVTNMLKGSDIKLHQKMTQNKEKTSARVEMNTGLNFGGVNTDVNMWVDTDMSEDTPKMVEVIKMPAILMAQISPEDNNKEYIVYDFEDIMNQGQGGVDFKQLMDFSKEMQPKMINFMKDYTKNFDPGFEIASYKGMRTVDESKLSIYKVTLDDKAFKKLVRYAVNNSMDDENTVKFIEEYMNALMGFVQMPSVENEPTKEEVSKEIEKLKEDLPELKKQFNEFMDTFKDVKVLGEKGIVIEYGINDEGYMVYENGQMDLNIDLKAIGKAIKNDALTENAGALKLGIDYETKIYNINEDIKIDMPDVNEKNSINYMDFLNQSIDKGTQEKPIESNK